MILNQEQLSVAHKIINLGLEDAAKSLAFFTKSETHLELDDIFSVSNFPLDDLTKEKGDTIYLLSTNLEGKLSGIAYLIFSKEEVDSIMKARYPNKQFEPDKYERKASGLILEMDNIITASVITQFANHFQCTTYGGVPSLEVVNKEETEKILGNGITNNDYVLDFKAKLISEGVNISADFIWFVNNNFIEEVVKISS